MIAANYLYDALEHRDALADPVQFFSAGLEMRRLCRTLNYAEWALGTPRSP